MANYQGNPQGGVKLVGPEQQIAAGAFQQMIGGNTANGMGLGAFLNGGQSVALPVASDPVMSALASAGGTDPMAALMGLVGGGGSAVDPMAMLMSAAAGGGGMPAGAETGAVDPQAQLEEAVVNALTDPNFARQLIRTDRSVLQKVVKLLSDNARLGG